MYLISEGSRQRLLRLREKEMMTHFLLAGGGGGANCNFQRGLFSWLGEKEVSCYWALVQVLGYCRLVFSADICRVES